MDGVDLAGLASAGGPWLAFLGLVGAVVRLVTSGRLTPRSTLEDLRADRDARVAEAVSREKSWRDAYLTSQATMALMSTQINELMTVARLSGAVFRAIPTGQDDQT